MDWQKYEASVRDEIGVPAGDTNRVQRAITSAISHSIMVLPLLFVL